MIELQLTIDGLGWSSDWNGYEVGYDNVDVVGLYTKRIEDDQDNEKVINFYIDMDTNRVLDMWIDLEE